MPGGSGTFTGSPATRYLVEVFGNTEANSAESELYLDESAVNSDAAGAASFTMRIDRNRADRVRSLTATITSDDGATSALSDALQLKEPQSR